MAQAKPLISTKSQDRSGNCGVFCVKFLLELFGITPSIRELEKIAGTTKSDGTSHGGISECFESFSVKFFHQGGSNVSTLANCLPAIVNYQDDGDGHYSVFLSYRNGTFTIWNPATGRIEARSAQWVSNSWISKRYGNGWFLSVPLNQ